METINGDFSLDKIEIRFCLRRLSETGLCEFTVEMVEVVPHDSGLRVPISSYLLKYQDEIRRKFVVLGPCQPRTHNFPQKDHGSRGKRRFFIKCIEKDGTFCFVCYLFKDRTRNVGGDAFVNKGFDRWHRSEAYVTHIGGIGSVHHQANEKYELFRNQKTIGFRGHDESESSRNKGNFRELLAWLAEISDDVEKIVFKNAPRYNQMTSGGIQKELINSSDDSSDTSGKEQLALCLRYIDKKGRLNEQFLGIVHVENTTAVSLKSAIQSLLMEHSLSMSKIQGQGYDGASKYESLVVVARDNCDCTWLFEQLSYLLSVIGMSCKRKEMIRMIPAQKVAEALNLGEIDSGKGLNQELSLSRPGDTRWRSYYKTILNVISLYPTIIKFLLQLEKVHPIRRIVLRNYGWENFLNRVISFCKNHEIEVPDMNNYYVPHGRPRRFIKKVKNIHRFRVEMFLSVINLQIQELNNRFVEKILRLAEFYPHDFTKVDLLELEFQLEMYIVDVRNDTRFQQVNDLRGLSCMLVETNKNKTFLYVYLLLKLVLNLPVATTSVERAFSAMSFVKSRLRNSMGDQLLNDSLVTFIENDIFLHVSDESVLRRFQNMKTRRINF
uniref:TTF-type domain-containing protein n=1 Tax=Kalanchoe fedtschenkoi TaxID=63787 RepID=A0A7N0UB67_KALFE